MTTHGESQPVKPTQIMGQLLVCGGGCCMKDDRGRVPTPGDWLRAEWKQRGLYGRVHLSVTASCLGPCSRANVAGVITANGPVWIGGLSTMEHYQALLDWATASAEAGTMLPLPEQLQGCVFERFRTDLTALQA